MESHELYHVEELLFILCLPLQAWVVTTGLCFLINLTMHLKLGKVGMVSLISILGKRLLARPVAMIDPS